MTKRTNRTVQLALSLALFALPLMAAQAPTTARTEDPPQEEVSKPTITPLQNSIHALRSLFGYLGGHRYTDVHTCQNAHCGDRAHWYITTLGDTSLLENLGDKDSRTQRYLHGMGEKLSLSSETSGSPNGTHWKIYNAEQPGIVKLWCGNAAVDREHAYLCALPDHALTLVPENSNDHGTLWVLQRYPA